MIKACIFDLDGTLANTLDSIVYYANAALCKHGYSPIEKARFNNLVGNGMSELVRGMLRISKPDFTQAEFEALKSTYDAMYNENYLYLTLPCEGITQLLRNLKQQKLKLAVLSNKPDFATQGVVKGLFGTELFDEVLGQKDSIERKPSPQGALMLAKKLGVSTKEVLYIGDSDVDMNTGLNAGMETVGVCWGFRSEEELVQNKANYIARIPEDIFKIVQHKNAGADRCGF